MSQLKLHIYANYFFDPKTYMQSYFRKQSLPNVTGTTLTPIGQRVAL